MAGVKRRLGAAHSSATATTNITSTVHNTPRESASNDSSSTRVTRNLRSSRDARAGQNDNTKANTTASSNISAGNQKGDATNKHGSNRPSHIITLKYGPAKSTLSKDANRVTPATPSAAAHTSSVPASTRETRNSRARAAASATPAVPAAQTSLSQFDGTPSVAAAPETPRSKRLKRPSVAEETPRSTRQSTRLKGTDHETLAENGVSDTPAAPKLDLSPSAPVASTRTRNRNRHVTDVSTNVSTRSRPPITVVKSPPPEDVAPESVEEPVPMDVEASHAPEPTPPAEESPKGTAFLDQHIDRAEYLDPEIEEESKPLSTRSSPLLSRKRKSLESDTHAAILSTSSSPSKKPKLEDTAPNHASELKLQNGDQRRAEDALSQPDEGVASKADEGSRQITEEADDSTTPDNATETTIVKATRGGRTRGRGRGARNRTSARFGVTRRGRGGTRAARSARTGRLNDRSSDIEFERSPSPSAATQKLRDRQRELDKAFRRLAAAQRLALAVLATQSEKRLARDKHAHKAVPEYEDINAILKAQLREKQDTLKREYDLKVAQEHRLFQANKEAIEDRCHVSSRYIQEEHLLASHGEYMTFIEGRRAAEDDEHTETDGSETENERGRRAPVPREVYRGFISSFVRNPAGATSYERAAFGWDDFVQRAKLGDDINPQMKEIRDAGPFAGLSATEVINMLLEATGAVEVRDGVAVKEYPPPAFTDVRPTALTALADIAAAEAPRPLISQPTPRLAAHRAILPQPPQPPPIHHGHPEPRPFVLPPPTPRGQPRRLLPAGQQIPPINESLGLPDPFSSRGGPPQLPPPPGSNFQRPPLPGYLTGHHHPIYYPPPQPHRPPY
ncbi:hypothetical protein BJY04DRAFT_206669 [Aspergillus karnatakaensis]|uniref:uncharacterized protein n=1 Tax=Aspergillus karnatakaensis TaxID=1810916 RepID=UPI003CCD9FC2